MIKGLRHYGIRTQGLSESIQFWTKLGFIVVSTGTENWNDVKLRIAKLRAPDGSVLELVQGNWPRHIALTVHSMETVGRTLGPGRVIKRNSGFRVRFIKGPACEYNTRIELVEEPK